MAITRDQLRQAAQSMAQDAGPGTTAIGVQLLLKDPTDYDRAIDNALGQFSLDRPNRRVKDYTVAATGFRFPLSGGSSILPVDPAAPSAPAVALAGAGAGNVDNGAHQWAVTAVYTYGETELSLPSVALTVADKTTNGKVTVTISDPADVTNLVSFNIYRTPIGDVDFKRVATVTRTVTTTVYTDNTADSGLSGLEPPQISLARNPDAWVEGAASIAVVWWPFDVTSQGDSPLDANSYRMRLDPGPIEVLEFVSDRPSTGQIIRLEYDKPHVIDNDDPTRSTIRLGDVNALITISAAMVLRVAAAKAAQNTGNTGLPNDVVDRRSQADIYRSLAADLMKVYGPMVGKSSEPADIRAQSGFLDLDVEPTYSFGGLGGYLWHPSRTR